MLIPLARSDALVEQRGKRQGSFRLSLAGEAPVSPAAAVYAGGAACAWVATSVLLRVLPGEEHVTRSHEFLMTWA